MTEIGHDDANENRLNKSVIIDFTDLHTYGTAPGSSGASERLPLSRFSEGFGHIHGNLRIIVAGRRLPHTGYSGPDDVCLGAWAAELTKLQFRLRTSSSASHTYDEWEQGQPAFHFARDGERVLVSVNASTSSSGASTDPDWQRISVLWCDMDSAIQQFETALRAGLTKELGPTAAEWCDRAFTSSSC